MLVRSVATALVAVALAGGVARAQSNADDDDPASVMARGAIEQRRFDPKHEFRVSLGYLPQDPFWKGVGPDASYTWHTSEYVSWEVLRVAGYTTYDSEIRRTLRGQFDATKDPYEKPQFMVGSHVQWTPFYGRYTFMNRRVLHQETYLTLGGAMWSWQKPEDPAINGGGIRPAGDFGLGFRWYASSRMSVKLELIEDFFMRSDGTVGDQFYMTFGGAFSVPKKPVRGTVK